jgi:hypothetical protein
VNRADEDHFRFCWHLSSIPKVSNILVRRRSFVLTLRDSYHNTSHIIMCVDHVSHIHNMTHAIVVFSTDALRCKSPANLMIWFLSTGTLDLLLGCYKTLRSFFYEVLRVLKIWSISSRSTCSVGYVYFTVALERATAVMLLNILSNNSRYNILTHDHLEKDLMSNTCTRN